MCETFKPTEGLVFTRLMENSLLLSSGRVFTFPCELERASSFQLRGSMVDGLEFKNGAFWVIDSVHVLCYHSFNKFREDNRYRWYANGTTHLVGAMTLSNGVIVKDLPSAVLAIRRIVAENALLELTSDDWLVIGQFDYATVMDKAPSARWPQHARQFIDWLFQGQLSCYRVEAGNGVHMHNMAIRQDELECMQWKSVFAFLGHDVKSLDDIGGDYEVSDADKTVLCCLSHSGTVPIYPI